MNDVHAMTTMRPPDEELVDQARRLLAERFPDALGAVLAGSAAAGRATATSDLDLAVLLADGAGTCRETIRFEGRVVELFLHTRAGLAELFAADAASRRAVIQTMYADGLVLHDPHGHVARARARAEDDLLDGPPPLDPEAVETRRYGLTDLLDDLADTRDRDESLAVGAAVLSLAADLLFDQSSTWSGTGKWFARQLRGAHYRLGPALLDGHRRHCETGDPALLAAAAREVLDLVGGPLSDGYRRAWQGVITPVTGGR
ncbi:nucleotidyltransferase domain-containing protein [Kitasatospora sp. NPDC097643]|uniref:nucleotidyltransferase domain-containing protein n=1 Tax=Kitasatospora sp. NPDC097643 TaxID=3157230 RepID=UPI003328F4E2